MGIDISFAVEQLIDGAWERVEEWKPGHNGREFRVEWYDTRSTDLFAILAGIDVPRPVTAEPIVPPRGIPDDATDETRSSADWGDAYGHSWLTARELVEYNWDTRVTYSFYLSRRSDDAVDFDQALAHCNQHGRPPAGWSMSGFSRDGTQVETTPTARSLAGPAFFNVIDRMAALAGDDLDSVRCVFWFDR